MIRNARAAVPLLLLLVAPATASTQQVVGVVRDDLGNVPIPDVVVTLLAEDGTRVASVVTDTVGVFRVRVPSPGTYSLTTEHVAWAPYRTTPLRIRSGEVLRLEFKLSRTVHALDALNVVARGRRHDPTYEGLYARIPRFPMRVGPNRIIVKGDMEMVSALTVGDVLERFFFRFWAKRGGACVYWNGHQISPFASGMLYDMSVDELEAIEVYTDYLLAPSSMMGPPMVILATQCSGVVALWGLRPDLPGR